MSTTVTGTNEPPSTYTPHDQQHSPVVLYQLEKRSQDWQLHLADRITTFAGSMAFVWVHLAIFALWVATGFFGKDPYPFQFLTFLVSLEAIFLLTFVMIGQNRQAAFQQGKADHDFHTAETELKGEHGPHTHNSCDNTGDSHDRPGKATESGREWHEPERRLRWERHSAPASREVVFPDTFRRTRCH